MQQTTESVGCHQMNRTESEGYDGAQTFMRIIGETNLLELILSPENLNRSYRQVKGNDGSGGVDKMGTSELLPYLNLHKDELIEQLLKGKYRPNPVRRVDIPKDNGKSTMR